MSGVTTRRDNLKTVKVMVALTVEMHARLKYEADLLQSSVAGVARARIARSLAAQDASRRGDGDETEARAA